jgi:alpha-glucosidase
MALLLSIKGTVCIYQGEELGLPEADIPYEKIRDPYGLTFWPKYKGRDGCRTPIPWSAGAPHCGFSEREPWLPIPSEHVPLAVDRQRGDARSMFELTRRLLSFRRLHPELVRGSIHFLDAPEQALAFERRLDGARTLCAFNLGPSEVAFDAGVTLEPLELTGAALLRGTRVALPPHGFGFADIRGAP